MTPVPIIPVIAKKYEKTKNVSSPFLVKRKSMKKGFRKIKLSEEISIINNQYPQARLFDKFF